MWRKLMVASSILLTWIMLGADSNGKAAAAAAREHRQRNESAILSEFFQLLAIPNVASSLPDMARNAAHIREMMRRRGIETQLLEVPGAPAVVLGRIQTPGATRTLIFYAHYDGQPVEPAQWRDSPPFLPILRDGPLENAGKRIEPAQPSYDPEWRIYARSASDDKAPILAMLTALDALKAKGIALRSNITFFLDGEEERGSPHIGEYVRRFEDKLKGDVWIFCDGPVHQTRRQQIVFGARGSMGFNLTVYGPNRELHSGHYGNWAPNPAAMLVRLVAGMRDDDGRVLIPGFYDDVEPLSEADRRALAEVPDAAAQLREELGLARTEGGAKALDELITLPSLNVRGLAAAGVDGQSRNVIPTHATASIDVRLVKGMDHRRTMEKIAAHIRAQGYHLMEQEPDAMARKRYPKICRLTRSSGYNAVRAPMDSPLAAAIAQAVREARGGVILLPTLGGSLPIAPIAEVLRTPVIIVPIANHDNNQHGHNENIRLRNLWDGIETMAALLAM